MILSSGPWIVHKTDTDIYHYLHVIVLFDVRIITAHKQILQRLCFYMCLLVIWGWGMYSRVCVHVAQRIQIVITCSVLLVFVGKFNGWPTIFGPSKAGGIDGNDSVVFKHNADGALMISFSVVDEVPNELASLSVVGVSMEVPSTF